MTTRTMHDISKPRKSFSFSVSIDDPSISPLPRNPKQALSDPNWKSAMQSEFNALIRNNTWELVPRPCAVNVIRCMWIFRHKKQSNGLSELYKARLVGDGRSQIAGEDVETMSKSREKDMNFESWNNLDLFAPILHQFPLAFRADAPRK
ncbi:uncharacterized mitochondrial protein AtMg00820-like [Lotus japonicus]|uniref:uncharacterized mitochondrial protein AtMg00820-like n=1 Tax=Lotus japonicus TaxID=34305 RepID=UPI0025910D8B|nr:uncharacterized mitochondrial protein AtMg00820-like [Lotus japonicus]